MAWRTITVGALVWRYRVGSVSVVARADGRKLVGSLSEVTGLAWDVIERGQRKKTSDGMVTPKMVADWIERDGS